MWVKWKGYLKEKSKADPLVVLKVILKDSLKVKWME